MTKKCNALLLSAGRRKRLHDLLADYFNQHEIDGTMFVVDAKPELSSVCMSSSNAFKISKATETFYIDDLKQFIKTHDINVIIPTIDTELLPLAEFKDTNTSTNIYPIISSPSAVRTFSSKRSTYNFFKNNQINTPKIIDHPTKDDLPLFAKLDNSSCSIGAQKVETALQLEFILNSGKDYVFQEFIDGEEFTIDFYIDNSQTLLATIPRQRLETRAGEVSKALTVNDPELIQETNTVIGKLNGLFGPLCIQAIKNDDGIFFIEINTRFGGGYPLTHQSGVNFIEFIFNDYFNFPNQPISNWEDNMLMLRYDHEVIVSDYRI